MFLQLLPSYNKDNANYANMACIFSKASRDRKYEYTSVNTFYISTTFRVHTQHGDAIKLQEKKRPSLNGLVLTLGRSAGDQPLLDFCSQNS